MKLRDSVGSSLLLFLIFFSCVLDDSVRVDLLGPRQATGLASLKSTLIVYGFRLSVRKESRKKMMKKKKMMMMRRRRRKLRVKEKKRMKKQGESQ